MNEADVLKLPLELEPFREQFEKTVKPYIKITTKKGQTLPWQSKFGGNPYCPLDFNYPTGFQGKPLRLLAQINFKEVPKLESFPSTGILQFYIPADDETFGVESANSRRIIFFPDVIEDPSKLVNDFSFIQETGDFPLSHEGQLHFEIAQAAVPVDDFQFDQLVNNIPEDVMYNDHVWDSYRKLYSPQGHKIGGYAFFTQGDPRYYDNKDHTILLLQIDSDSELNLMWGDSGVANFFITPDDFKNLNFNRVLYRWDCY